MTASPILPTMRIAHLILAMALAVGTGHALGQAPDPSRLKPTVPRDTPTADAPTVAAAQALLTQAMKTFAQAPALECTSSVTVNIGEDVKTLVSESAFGPEGAMQVDTDSSLVVVRDGLLNVVVYAIPDRYLRVPVTLRVADEFESHYGDRALAGWEILMREAKAPEEWLDAIMMKSVGGARIIGLKTVPDDTGRTVQRISVAGGMGHGWLDYEPTSKLIVATRSWLFPQPGFEDLDWSMRLDIEPRVLDQLPKPIALDPGPRIPVGTPEQVDPIGRNRLVVGSPAPPLMLPTDEGQVVDLSTLRGKAVVLDFWATWCGPCKKSLPDLNDLYIGLGENTGNVQVYAVACWEQMAVPQDRLDTVMAFWSRAGYEVPTMIAADDATRIAWGIRTIPYTVVVDPKGIVAEIITGFRPDQAKLIKAAVDRALASK